MSDNEEPNSYHINDDEEEKNNVLINTMNILEKEFKNDNPSTINNQENQTSTNNDTIINLNKAIKENNLPYLDKDKNPEINIKDENYLEPDIKIEDYLNNFNDNIYNICEKCMKNDNNVFCKYCKKNLCNNCFKDCKKDFHEEIELQKLNDEIEYYKKEIKRIKKEYFIDPEKKENIGEKEPRSYQAMDENKISENYTEKNITYTNDILLIEKIIQKNYNNFIHYKNIKNCYRYMQRKYDINNYIIIEYRIGFYKEKIKIFGKNFVENNRIKCQIIFEDNKYELSEYFEIKNFANNNILQFKLIGINNITNMEDMFYYCESLVSLPDISKWNTSNVTNMEGMFYSCESLASLPDISKWNTSNITNMEDMFYSCESLASLPDISKWNTSNVTNIESKLS